MREIIVSKENFQESIMENKELRALIMAGGAGTRLKPITDNIPKPLAPIGEESAVSIILKMLSRIGVTQAAITLMHKGEMIEKSLGVSKHKISLTYIKESEPLGTAGGVKNAEEFLLGCGDFIVTSGDAVCDFDLADALLYHRETGAIATLILTKVNDPSEYGAVIGDFDLRGRGEIKSFIEKPPASQAYSQLVNTGIYILSERILDLIPRGQKFDFGRDLFPNIIGNGLYGYTASGYWCDIGSTDAYKRCVFDAADKKIKIVQGLSFSKDRSVILDDCKISQSAKITDSVLSHQVTVCENSTVYDSIICENTLVEENVHIERSVIGAGSMIASDSSVIGAKLPAGTIVPPGVKIEDEKNAPLPLYRGRIYDLDKNDIPYLAAALLECTDKGRIGIMWQGDRVPQADGMLNVLGDRALSLGRGYSPLAVFAAKNFDLALTVFIESEGEIVLLDKNGDPISHEEERAIVSNYKKTEPKRAKSKPANMEELFLSCYFDKLSDIAGRFDILSGIAVSISANAYASPFAHALHRFGAKRREDGENGYHIELSDKAELLWLEEIKEGKPFFIGGSHIAALLLLHHTMPGEKVYLPCRAPKILDGIIETVGAYPIRYAENSAEKRREQLPSHMWLYDPLAALLSLFALIKDNHSSLFAESLKLPEFVFIKKTVETKNKSASAIMRDISHGRNMCEGARIDDDSGSIIFVPLSENRALICCDAEDEESAAEMIDELERRFSLHEI